MTVEDARRWYQSGTARTTRRWWWLAMSIPSAGFAWSRQYFGAIPARDLPLRKPSREPEQDRFEAGDGEGAGQVAGGGTGLASAAFGKARKIGNPMPWKCWPACLMDMPRRV
jgi:hypothetical protein